MDIENALQPFQDTFGSDCFSQSRNAGASQNFDPAGPFWSVALIA
jgi:hypothetical protein